MSAKQNAPVIIKRKKVIGGDGHHGGAWKVAYADFVTAMMAFFMLMWLLNATTEKQRKGIADYFNPTIPVNRISGGGDGSFGGDSVFTEETLAQNGIGASVNHPTEQNRARGETGVDDSATGMAEAADAAAYALVHESLTARSGESISSDMLLRHVVTRLTDEGLIIELFDIPGDPLFRPGTDQPSDTLRALTRMLSEVAALVRNPIAVEGHVAAQPVVLLSNQSWDRSTARADAMRELLERYGTPPQKIMRVTGHADREHVASDPMAIRNNRVELVLLRSVAR